MNQNVKLAKQLIMIAKSLIASDFIDEIKDKLKDVKNKSDAEKLVSSFLKEQSSGVINNFNAIVDSNKNKALKKLKDWYKKQMDNATKKRPDANDEQKKEIQEMIDRVITAISNKFEQVKTIFKKYIDSEKYLGNQFIKEVDNIYNSVYKRTDQEIKSIDNDFKNLNNSLKWNFSTGAKGIYIELTAEDELKDLGKQGKGFADFRMSEVINEMKSQGLDTSTIK